MIYVACPFWHNDPAVRSHRRETAILYADRLTRAGVLNYSPLSYTERYKDKEVPEDYWIRHGQEMVRACTEIHVLCLPGWSQSGGIQGELSVAKQNRLKIEYKKKEIL